MIRTLIVNGFVAALALTQVGFATADNTCAHNNDHVYELATSNTVHSDLYQGLFGFLSNTDNGLTGKSEGIRQDFSVRVYTSARDCGSGTDTDFTGEYDTGIGGGFFGATDVYDPDCGYDLAVHASTGMVTDPFAALVDSSPRGAYGVDDVEGPTPLPNGETVPQGLVSDGAPYAGNGCVTDGTITPETDPYDCLNDFTPYGVGQSTWEPGPCLSFGGDGGYWLFVDSRIAMDGLSIQDNPAAQGHLIADA